MRRRLERRTSSINKCIMQLGGWRMDGRRARRRCRGGKGNGRETSVRVCNEEVKLCMCCFLIEEASCSGRRFWIRLSVDSEQHHRPQATVQDSCIDWHRKPGVGGSPPQQPPRQLQWLEHSHGPINVEEKVGGDQCFLGRDRRLQSRRTPCWDTSNVSTARQGPRLPYLTMRSKRPSGN